MNEPEQNSQVNNPFRSPLRNMVALVLVVAFAAGVVSLLGIGCPIKFFTGLSCPSCGMTRAWYEAFHLHFLEALAYHPLFWMFPFAVLLIGFQPVLNKKLFIALASIMVVLLLGVWFVRLSMPVDTQLLFGSSVAEDVVAWEKPKWTEVISSAK